MATESPGCHDSGERESISIPELGFQKNGIVDQSGETRRLTNLRSILFVINKIEKELYRRNLMNGMFLETQQKLLQARTARATESLFLQKATCDSECTA